jgi:hypothetical protein
MRRTRLPATAALTAAAPAHAVGEQVFLVLGLDIVLLVVAIAILVFGLNCPARVRVLLACVYIGTLALLFFLPVQLIPAIGGLNAPLHFALPWLAAAVAFLVWRRAA